MNYQLKSIGNALVKFQAIVIVLGMLVLSAPMSANAVDAGPSNPVLTGSCGLDIALVMDTSGSIGGDSTSGELNDMQTALQGFVAALLPGTPTMFSLVSFDNSATTELGFSSDGAVVDSAIEATDGNGATNWQDGLLEAASTFDPRAGKGNLVIFASDGNPTVNNGIGGGATTGDTDGNDLINAVAAANDIKTGASISGGTPTRIMTIGIGADVNQANLEAISSSDAYFEAADFDALEATLALIATELCGGSLNVNKVIDADGNLGTTDDQSSGGAGWEFIVTGQDPNPVTDVTGSFSIEANAGAYSVTEIDQEGYDFVGASCVNQDQQIQGSPASMTIGAISVDDEEIVSCTFYNTPTVVPENSATVYADKVLCDAEQYLPNWGFGAEVTIGASTASDWVAQSDGHCQLVEWNFQWTPDVVDVDENPGDNVAEAGSPWTTFSGSVSLENPDGGTFWFRELIPAGYLPFSGDTEAPYDDVSAEFYCNTDVLNYDNFDYISGVDADETFYCVGFNVQTEPQDLPECSDNVDNSDDEDSVSDEQDPGCWSIPGDSESYDPNDDDETNYPECSDGVDNGDGEDSVADSEDPGCQSGEGGSYNPNDNDESDGQSEVDVCSNLPGNQSEVPDGRVSTGDGECHHKGGGGGGGHRRVAKGAVLGAATTCGPLLTDYLHKDWKNNPEEVKKLQMFLNKYVSAGLTESGLFGSDTFEWVKTFQINYGNDVLTPWVGFPASGITAPTTPTGFVYQTTKWKINNIWCPGSEAFPATLI